MSLPSAKAPTAEIVVGTSLGDFLELTKPRITAMVVLTTVVGMVLAWPSAENRASAWLVAATVLGTAFLAAGASALNMWLEREQDRRMDRTHRRPLPGNRLEPDHALAFGAILGIGGTLILALAVNAITAVLGALTLVLYLFAYTPLKLRTSLSTLVGAVPGAIPPMMGWTAIDGRLGPSAWALFALLFFWQMPHFFAIAWLYRDDYRRAGFRMISADDPTGRRTAGQMSLFTVLLVAASLTPAVTGLAGLGYVVAAVVLGGGFLWAALAFARERSRATARRVMLYSVIYLPLSLLVLVGDRLT